MCLAACAKMFHAKINKIKPLLAHVCMRIQTDISIYVCMCVCIAKLKVGEHTKHATIKNISKIHKRSENKIANRIREISPTIDKNILYVFVLIKT